MTIWRFALMLALIGLAGCDRIDPYSRDGSWRPNGANNANLRAMVAVPADLASATPSARADGVLAASALDRLRHDRVRTLPDSGLAQVMPVHGGSATQPPAAPPSASGN